MTIKRVYLNELERKTVRTRIQRLKYSKADCKLHEKMPKSTLKRKKQRRLKENKKKSSSLP